MDHTLSAPEHDVDTSEGVDTTEDTDSGLPASPIGARLRSIRRQQGMSLADVQTRSGGRWKSVVVGAYERGDRSISIARLAELSEFYGVPLVDVLPTSPTEQAKARLAAEEGGKPSGPVRLDLTKLRRPRTPEVAAVARFALQVQRRRGDHNGKVLTLRGGDLSTIAIAIGRDDDAVLDALEREDALYQL